MFTIKMIILATAISCSALSLNNDKNHTAINYQKTPEIINYLEHHGAQYKDIARDQKGSNIPDVKSPVPVQVEASGEAMNIAHSINKDKTYEQCEREAFEYIYAQVNSMLDNVTKHCNDYMQM